jgi:hypothetical protein
LRKFEGSVVVISHDRRFLEELEPTHVVTVRGGKVDCQERGLREEDWNDPIDSREEVRERASTSIFPTLSLTLTQTVTLTFRGHKNMHPKPKYH